MSARAKVSLYTGEPELGVVIDFSTVPSIEVLNPEIGRHLQNLEERSPLLRVEMDSLRKLRLPVLIGSRDDIRSRVPNVMNFESENLFLGYTAWFRGEGSDSISGAAIAIDLERISDFTKGRRDEEVQRAVLIETVLIHEVYGHLLSAGLSGSYKKRCRDPQPGDRRPEWAACVMKRENRLRRDLGLPMRKTYGVEVPQ